MKRIVIIDDEFDSRQGISTLIKSFCPDVEVCGEADGVESGYLLIRQVKPDIVLLDISMEDGSGFDLLDKLPNPDFHIIFITAHDDFALKAFRYNALNYLLKPINPTQLVQTIDRINIDNSEDRTIQINNLLENNRSQTLNKIMLSSLEGMVFVNLDDIIRLESDGSYTNFYLRNNEHHLITRSMKDFEELFPKDRFFRLHLSHLVNIAYVKKILREDGGCVLMEDGGKVPIARRRKEEFIDLMKLQAL